MRSDLTSAFTSALDKTVNQPGLLLKLEWPALPGFAARTLHLADRSLTVEGQAWTALVTHWDPSPASTQDAVEVTLWNGPVDFGQGPERFSDVLTTHPPETAWATLFRWFEDEGLGEADLTPILHARVDGPVVHDIAECRFRLVPLSADLGSSVLGNTITRSDYPNAPEETIGRTKPIIIGQVAGVPALRVRAVAKTRLLSVALPKTNQLAVASTEGFPDTGTLLLNDDILTYTGKTGQQFTGVSGVQEFHYADDEIIEQVSDHRFLVSDPDYPVASIQNVHVAGQPVPPGEVTLNVNQGEVVFTQPPRRVRSIDTKFLQAQFDSVAPGNTALDAAFAMQPNLRTRYARLNQVNPLLKLKQEDAMAPLGQIGRVLLRIEHFMEEQLISDSVAVRLSGWGPLGVLSPPAADDAAVTTGSTDISHNHLDDFGFPIDIPQPVIVPTSQADHVVEQSASGTGRNLTVSAGSLFVTLNFPALPAGALQADYLINLSVVSGVFGIGHAGIILDGRTVATWNAARGDFDYSGGFSIEGSSQPGSMVLGVTGNGGQWTVDLISLKRLVFYPHQTAASQSAQNTIKSGSTTGIVQSPVLAAQTEKATRSIVDFFDITTQVNGDWNWFTHRELEIEYTGNADGRTVFVLHAAFEIEYARRRLALTDEVTADVDGIVDDSSGTVTGTAGKLIERPDHVIAWSLLNLPGLGPGALNLALFAESGQQFEEAVPGGYRLSGRIDRRRDLVTLWKEWMQSSRSHLFWDGAGQACLLFRPFNSSLNQEGGAVKALDDGSLLMDASTGRPRLRFVRSPVSHLATRLDVAYDRNWNSKTPEERYRRLVQLQDPSQLNLLGLHQSARHLPLDWCREEAMAEDVARFHLGQTAQPDVRVEYDAVLGQMDLEHGDIVTFSTGFFAGVSNILALVERVDPLPPDSVGGLQAVRLHLKPFPRTFLQEVRAEALETVEGWDLWTQFQELNSETLDVAEVPRFHEIPEEWLQEIDLLESPEFLQQGRWEEPLHLAELMATVDASPMPSHPVALQEAAFVSAAGGWGRQRWGLSGWGGRENLS